MVTAKTAAGGIVGLCMTAMLDSCRTAYVPVSSTADTQAIVERAADHAQLERRALDDYIQRLSDQREGAEPDAATVYAVHIDRLNRARVALAEAESGLNACKSTLTRVESESAACASALALSGQRISKLESETPGFFSKLKEKWDIGSAAFVAGFVSHILWTWVGGFSGIAALVLRLIGRGAGF